MDFHKKKLLRKRKPFRILRMLDHEEIDHFEQFLQNPFFNQNPKTKTKTKVNFNLQEFFYHCRQLDVWNSEEDRDGFLQASGLSISKNGFDKLASSLYQQLISFIGLQGYLNSKRHEYLYGLQFLADKNIKAAETEKKIIESKRILENSPKDAEFYRILLDMNLVQANGSQSRTERPETRKLDQLHLHVDAYYFIQKLRFLCASINEQKVYSHFWEPLGEEYLLKWFSANYDNMPTLAKIYFHAYRVLRGDSHSGDIQEFRSLLTVWEKKNGSQTETSDLHGYLLNHFLMQLNNGYLDALVPIDNLYRDLIDNNTILENGQIPSEHFKNIITIRCRCQNVNEAREFFNLFSQRLQAPMKSIAIRYNNVALLFHEGQYLEAEKILVDMIENPQGLNEDHCYGLDIRCLLLKTYFLSLGIKDLDAWDEVDEKLKKMLRAFQTYIKRREVADMSRIRFENFRKALEKLYHLRYGGLEISGKEKKREELSLEFKSSSNLPEKGWLIEQVLQQDHQ